jgi:hypothetical protein
MTWGIGEWGLTYFGTDPSLYMQNAVAVTTHSVLVTLSTNAQAISPLAPGDALNPRSWTVTRVTGGLNYTVIGVLKITDRRFQLFLRTALSSVNFLHRVTSTDLRTPTGLLISAPYYTEFRGVLPEEAIVDRHRPFDLASTEIVGGSLKTNEAGGYVRVYGDELIKKMIIRRLVTMPGAYFHIAPSEFGQDLKIKEPLRISSLAALKVQIEQEVLKEPGVTGAQISLTLSSSVLTIRARIQTDSGESEVDFLINNR